MQAHPRSGGAASDEAIQRAILALALAAYPKLRTLPELAREIGSKRAATRAVAQLVDHGLLEQHEVAFKATRVAIRCHRLDAW
jgi:hypothetical protein